MTVSDLEPMIYRCIENWAAGRRHERIGLVTSYDPKTHTAKAMLQPEQFETGSIPIETHAMGNNYGHVTGLVPGDGKTTGDQVVVRFLEGDFESGKIAGRLHSDVDMPPQVQSGETAIISQFNASIKMNKDGSTAIATTQKQADGQTDNTKPDMSHSATAGNYAASATKANGKGGKMTHTASDGAQISHSITMDPKSDSSAFSTGFSSGLRSTKNSVIHSSTDGTNTHTMILDLLAKTLTHKASGGGSSHSIVLDLVNGIVTNTTAAHSRTAATSITDTAGTTHTRNAGTSITDAASSILHNGNTNVTGTLGVSGLASLLGGLGTGAFLVASDGAGGLAQATQGLTVTQGFTTDTAAATSWIKLPVYTIAGLAGIASPQKGMMVYCSDTVSNTVVAFNAIPTGGGATAVNCPVAYNGASWRYC
jgi:hypothetical protein